MLSSGKALTHDIFFIVEQWISQPANIFAFKFDIGGVHHKFALTMGIWPSIITDLGPLLVSEAFPTLG